MQAIADEDLKVLKDAARKWCEATLSRAEHKHITDVLAKLDHPPFVLEREPVTPVSGVLNWIASP